MTNKRFILLSFLLLSVCVLQAQPTSLIREMADADSARLVEIFKDIHQNPELAFMETRTAAIVAKELNLLGYKVITGIGKTGVAGILRNGDGPVVMYRTELDCNAVKEITSLAYASTKTMINSDGLEVPVMHACGHDAHIAWMLGIARIMVSLKKEWKGTLVFIGQPAEEVLSGAKAMVDDKMYEKGVPVPDFLVGLHSRPIPVGTVDNGYGNRTAGSDQLDVVFYGVGGHGSAPEYAKDPIVMGSNAVMQYQTIISRNIAAQDAAVLTVGAFNSGNSNNIIPASALLKLNLRWFNEKTRDVLLDGIKNVNEGVAIANNLPKELYPELKMKGFVYPLENNSGMVTKINRSLSDIIDKKNILSNTPSLMGSEDFHHLVIGNKRTVYDYIMVGIANDAIFEKAVKAGKKYPFYNHNGNYEVDLSAIPLGTKIGANALLEMFRK
jgi:amidohydrolase